MSKEGAVVWGRLFCVEQILFLVATSCCRHHHDVADSFEVFESHFWDDFYWVSVDPVEVKFEPEPSREGHAHNPPDERVGVEVNPPVEKVTSSHLAQNAGREIQKREK